MQQLVLHVFDCPYSFHLLKLRPATICLATAEYPATIVPDSTCAHIFKERDMCRSNLTQVAGYSAVKLRKYLLDMSPTEENLILKIPYPQKLYYPPHSSIIKASE